MAREKRSVRVDAVLLAELEELARQGQVPVTFAEQVDAGLRLLARGATEQQLRHAARRLAADQQRAEQAFDRLHRGQR